MVLAEQTLFAGFGEVGLFGGSKRIFDGRAVKNGHQRLTQLGAGDAGSRVGQVGTTAVDEGGLGGSSVTRS